jgi:hypothetical protein
MTADGRTGRSMATAMLLCGALPAVAATILGTVQRDGRPPAAPLPLQLSCGDKAVAKGSTDAQGGYRLTVSGAGRCQLSVDGVAADVLLSNQAPVQYDFDLRGSGARATLQRR